MRFYLLANGTIESGLSLDTAIKSSGVLAIGNGYAALGVEDRDGACDLLVRKDGKFKISQDYKSTRFKDDKYLVEEVIPMLKYTFGVN